jgi:hypothetical protein
MAGDVTRQSVNRVKYLLLIGLCLLTIRCFSKSYIRGLAMAGLLIVCVTDKLRLDLPGGLPEVTIQRLLLLISVYYWRREGRYRLKNRDRGVNAILLANIGLVFCSTVFSIAIDLSLKSIISLAFEEYFFYWLVYTSVRSEKDILLVFKHFGYGLGIVAVLGFIEYYTQFNPVDEYIVQGPRPDMGLAYAGWYDVMGTFPHRILFGYAMVCGAAIAFGCYFMEKSKLRRYLWLALLLFFSATTYFSNSRGPWFALPLAVGVIAVWGSSRSRKLIFYLGVAILIGLLVKPGVRDTIVELVSETFQKDTHKGESYEYRWQCWSVAYKMIVDSPVRLLFGYGGLSTQRMDLQNMFAFGGSTYKLGYTSWDNQYAANLIEFGMLGFMGFNLVFFVVCTRVFARHSRLSPSLSQVVTSAKAVLVVYLFLMTNVYSFSNQLKYMLWGIIALAVAAPRMREKTVTTPVEFEVTGLQSVKGLNESE